MVVLSVVPWGKVILFSIALFMAGIGWGIYKNKKRKKDAEQMPDL